MEQAHCWSKPISWLPVSIRLKPQAKVSSGGSMMTYLAIAGLAVGGGMIVTKVFSK